jgi:alkylation response protein AidB-like acyl-CoA dehydrogenase
MAAIMPRDLLSDSLLERLGGTADQASGQASMLAGDIARLAEIGYLKVALPPEFGGLGCTLRQAACGQRRLARHAPRTALAVSAHLYWTGAAADAYRAGDHSVRWILVEAAGGALFAGGHGGTSGEAGGDLRFADPRSRCEPSGESGYQFRDSGVLTTVTPAWDWIAVHAVHQAARPQSVIAFAGRGTRCTPPFRVARVQPVGTPADVFATSALTWGHSILASVEYSGARHAFNAAITEYAEAAASAVLAGEAGDAGGGAGAASPRPAAAGHPAGRWPVAEAGTRLDAMKAKIAEITHPWQLIQEPAPDLGGQHLISLYAMRHEVAEGAASVHGLVEQLTGTQRRKSHPVS